MTTRIARANISATRKGGLKTGNRRVEIAPVKVIVMPGYEAPVTRKPALPAAPKPSPAPRAPATQPRGADKRAWLYRVWYRFENRNGEDALDFFTQRASSPREAKALGRKLMFKRAGIYKVEMAS